MRQWMEGRKDCSEGRGGGSEGRREQSKEVKMLLYHTLSFLV